MKNNTKLMDDLKRGFPHMPIKTEMEAEMVDEARHYNNIWSTIIDLSHWRLMKEELKARELDPNEFLLYYRHLPIRINAFESESNLVRLWISITDYNIHTTAQSIFFDEVFKYLGHHFLQRGLLNALDPNKGGLWNPQTTRVASLIIFG